MREVKSTSGEIFFLALIGKQREDDGDGSHHKAEDAAIGVSVESHPYSEDASGNGVEDRTDAKDGEERVHGCIVPARGAGSQGEGQLAPPPSRSYLRHLAPQELAAARRAAATERICSASMPMET